MEEFITQLLQAQGIPDDLEPAVYEQLKKDTTDSAVNFINRKLIDSMSDQVLQQFNDLIDKDDATPEQVQSFIEQNIPDKDKITTQALLEFRSLYLGEKAQAA